MRRQMVEEPPNPRVVAGLPGPEKQKRPNLAISSFKKGQSFQIRKKAK
jgi:hypothetical protein